MSRQRWRGDKNKPSEWQSHIRFTKIKGKLENVKDQGMFNWFGVKGIEKYVQQWNCFASEFTVINGRTRYRFLLLVANYTSTKIRPSWEKAPTLKGADEDRLHPDFLSYLRSRLFVHQSYNRRVRVGNTYVIYTRHLSSRISMVWALS